MSIKLMSLIWEAQVGTIDMIETAVLLRLADFAADDGTSVYPGYTRISRDSKVSYRTVTRTIKSLIEKNILIKIQEGNSITHQASVFKINVEALKELGVETPHPIDTQSPLDTQSRGAMDCQSRGALDRESTQPPLTTTINNHHISPLVNNPSLKKSPKENPTSIPEDAVLTVEWKEVAVSAGIHASQVDTVFTIFKNYWLERTDAKGKKLDWKRTWQSWCLRNVARGEFTRVKRTIQPGTNGDIINDLQWEELDMVNDPMGMLTIN